MKSIRIEQPPFEVPLAVREAIDRLIKAGHLAYVVGGSVRDYLLKRETKDHDIATSASPDEIEAIFPHSIAVGKAFGVIKVIDERLSYPLEIATFRKDLGYRDHRHPVGIVFSEPAEDALRRDFTINGLFYDPKQRKILDWVGGLEDLETKQLRAIGDPQKRFKEDALRILRGLRFAATLDFDIEAPTWEALCSCVQDLNHVSKERILIELSLLLCAPGAARGWKLLEGSGIKSILLREAFQSRRIERTLANIGEGASEAVGWAAVLLSVAEGDRTSGPEVEGVQKIAKRFKMSRELSEKIDILIMDQPRYREVFRMRAATLERQLLSPHFEEGLALHRADSIARDGNLAMYEFWASKARAARDAPPREFKKLITGADLVELGFEPSPKFAAILSEVEDLQLEQKLTSKEDALEYVVKRYVR